MGMIEDMDAAVLWLSSVTIRFVNSIQQTKLEPKSDGDTQSDKRERRRR